MADIFTPKGLGEILGGPMIAMVQGEALAAQTTAQFIREVGFEKTNEPEDNFGALKMITFTYQKQADDNKPETFEIKIPLLSLVPIPSLQIKNATVELALQLTGFDPVPEPSTQPAKFPFIKSPIAGMRGLVAQRRPATISDSNSNNAYNNFSMNVKIELGQADMTIGLQNILGIMDRGLQETKK